MLLALLLVATQVSAGQTWMTWNIRSGLPSNNLSCLAINEGMMAVGSDKGIGVYLENYSAWFNLANYHEQLAGLAVRSLDFDDYKTLWAATPAGLFAIDLEDFPDGAPRLRRYDHEHGLSTIDVEVVQVVDNKIYVGCYGGWLFYSSISPGSSISSFVPVNRAAVEDLNKFMSVGITALAMDYPGGGIYSTKGKGLLRAADGSNLVGQDELFSDWVNDFWSFEEGNANRIIAVTQNQMNLISNNRPVGTCSLPAEDCWISCITTAPDEERDEYKRKKPKGYLHLETFIGKRTLIAGTRGQGLWLFDDGRWNNLTMRDSPLPSDNINKVYYLPGPKKIAILSDGGLTMLGITQDTQFDLFQVSGSDPYWAKTFWPFMQSWGPYVFGYPSQKCYPIEPFISYGKMLQGKDIWIAHDRGISRFVFPSAPFIGAMQYRFHLAGRFESKANDPSKDMTIEDNSTSGDRPPTSAGEELWHHYCKEQPTDFCLAPIAEIYVSLDMKTMAGPGEYLIIDAPSLDSVSAEDIAAAITEHMRQQSQESGEGENPAESEALASGSESAESASDAENADSSSTCAPATATTRLQAIIRVGESLYDERRHQLYTVASLMQECPLHAIPSEDINDLALDLAERVWVIFDNNQLACLDNRPGEIVPDPSNNDWHEFATDQLPWAKYDDLLCVQRVGSAIYVSAKDSGVYYLPTAHAAALKDLRPSDWRRIEFPSDSKEIDQFKRVIAIEYWKTNEGAVVALLFEKGLATFDGSKLSFIGVPERKYTCMVQDRNYNLWLGSFQGLSYLTPDVRINEIHGRMNDFNSEKVVAIAAAPDDAKYPYTIAVAVDEYAKDQGTGVRKLYRSSDPPPSLARGRDSMYRLRVLNADVSISQIMLYDGEKWEPMSRPGVRALMFDQEFLWIATSCRVMRLYMPVVVQSY
ncbi:MAG: hypothetical protein CVV42_10395 [Candidatus Riflebacteria bacterium HGW-Riflebacteria-2]|nr:MAG: hypothetical protein CVV42_10395 [Candidatus Riflebacteria bacterium HGW-Riflebacteria-2]